MNATTQHEFHPDAESLNAFAEHALGERERGRVLNHLAVCDRCRQVVALAHKAALEAAAQEAVSDAKVAARAAARIQPTAWWKQWRLVWVPTAVAAAFAVASISIYIRQAEQSRATIKIAEQTTPQNQAMPANKTTQPAPPSAAPVAARPPVRTVKREAAVTAPNPPSQDFVVTAAMPAQPEATDRTEATRAEAPPASGATGQQFAGENYTTEQSTAAYPPQPAVAAWQQEQRHKAAGAAPASSTRQVTDSANQLETQAQPRFAKQKQATVIVAGAMKAVHLPSGLPAVSMTAAGSRRLAIDQAGTLFLSVDAGNHWDIVTQQWTGRAVAVRSNAPPAAVAPANSSSDTGPAPSPASFFEILNDKNQAWLSTDGETWIAK